MTRNYETVSEAVNDLIHRGYTSNFGLKAEAIYSDESGIHLKPEQFNIDEVYRFEGDTDPADETIVYAISSHLDNTKGVLVNGYGISADPVSSALIQKLVIHH